HACEPASAPSSRCLQETFKRVDPPGQSIVWRRGCDSAMLTSDSSPADGAAGQAPPSGKKGAAHRAGSITGVVVLVLGLQLLAGGNVPIQCHTDGGVVACTAEVAVDLQREGATSAAASCQAKHLHAGAAATPAADLLQRITSRMQRFRQCHA